MKRSMTLSILCLAGLFAVLQQGTPLKAAESEKQYLELRHYDFSSAEQQGAFETYLGDAAIPALNRLGITPVGVFKDADPNTLGLYVLLPHPSLASVAGANSLMLADKAYQEAGKAVIDSPKESPGYQRFESNLLLSFDGCPKVEVPVNTKTRVFQLRTYESHNTTKAKRKIEMFNDGGEMALFRKTGLHPVFFGETLVGKLMPNLTYMVGFDDAEAQQQAWSTFGNHPEWKRMSSLDYFKDTVSHVTNIVLRPADCSQI